MQNTEQIQSDFNCGVDNTTVIGPVEGHQDPRIFVPCIKGLAAHRDVEGIARFLKDEDWHVRVMAVIGLGVVGDARAIVHLISAMQDKDARVQAEAGKVLRILLEELTKLLPVQAT